MFGTLPPTLLTAETRNVGHYVTSRLPVRLHWVDVEEKDGSGKDSNRCIPKVEEQVVYCTEPWDKNGQEEQCHDDTSNDILVRKEDRQN